MSEKTAVVSRELVLETLLQGVKKASQVLAFETMNGTIHTFLVDFIQQSSEQLANMRNNPACEDVDLSSIFKSVTLLKGLAKISNIKTVGKLAMANKRLLQLGIEYDTKTPQEMKDIIFAMHSRQTYKQ